RVAAEFRGGLSPGAAPAWEQRVDNWKGPPDRRGPKSGRTNAATAQARGATNDHGTQARALGSSGPTMIIRSYLVTLWAVLFVSCGPTVAQSDPGAFPKFLHRLAFPTKRARRPRHIAVSCCKVWTRPLHPWT